MIDDDDENGEWRDVFSLDSYEQLAFFANCANCTIEEAYLHAAYMEMPNFVNCSSNGTRH